MATVIKPFLKWAGGKSQLLSEIDAYIPFNDKKIAKYAEPFIGGGAVLFHILNNYSVKEVYISDINPDLIDTYITIRDNVLLLINFLREYEDKYSNLDEINRKKYYSEQRTRFNELKQQKSQKNIIEKSALMIFLNRTCFNGLYRVNAKGLFNVPAGNYKNPTICDTDNLLAISGRLSNVIIKCAPYFKSEEFIDENTFVYFDPPYRPLPEADSFTAYSEDGFGDKEQQDLASFYDKMCKKGAICLLSNSDPKNTNPNDNFFDDLYSDYAINRVLANRMINSNASNRGKITEILVSNGIKKEKNENMYLSMNKKELALEFEKELLETNRGYNYYINWVNITGLTSYQCEIHAMDLLIRCDDESFKSNFKELITKLPKVIEVFPFLFALSKTARRGVIKKDVLKIISSDIDDKDFGIFSFNGKQLIDDFTEDKVEDYYRFFVKMGLKSLFQNLLEKSVKDYITGVLVGLDSNGRKNRGGKAFELACEPIIMNICKKYNLIFLKQKKFKDLVSKYEMTINKELASRKADFIIINSTKTKYMNIEVNFYNGGGSKPEEIIDSYINRQNELDKVGASFILITDGNCWKGTTHQLEKGFNNLKYLMNYRLAKNGMLEEAIRKEFEV